MRIEIAIPITPEQIMAGDGKLERSSAMDDQGKPFWCPICRSNEPGDVPSLQISSRDGHTLFTVCAKHVPEQGQKDFTVTTQPNADGVVRTMYYEDLK